MGSYLGSCSGCSIDDGVRFHVCCLCACARLDSSLFTYACSRVAVFDCALSRRRRTVDYVLYIEYVPICSLHKICSLVFDCE
jgi:hypothetical protein